VSSFDYAPIPDIPFPPEHLEDLKKLGPLMIASMERDGLPIATGQIKLGRLEPEVDIAFFYFTWTSEANEVIQHLNMVINDLRCLHKNFRVLGGSPWTRYELLMRTYFHEYYRMREILSTFLSILKDRGHITKQDVKESSRSIPRGHRRQSRTAQLSGTRKAAVHRGGALRSESHVNCSQQRADVGEARLDGGVQRGSSPSTCMRQGGGHSGEKRYGGGTADECLHRRLGRDHETIRCWS
jgi:hypothetical protein